MIPIPLQRFLFSTFDYRDFLLALIRELGGQRGYKKSLADAIECQPAYLSQVLAGIANLTPEQAEKLCQFWGLSDLESECFFQLVLLGRAGTPSLKKRLERNLLSLRDRWLKTDESFETPAVSDHDQATTLYASWLNSAVHMLLSVPGMGTPQALARHLHQELSVVEKSIADLEHNGLIVKTGPFWRTKQSKIHALRGDFFAEIHHKNWRLEGLNPGASGRERAIRYTTLHSLSRADFLQMRELIEKMIQDSRRLIEPSPEEMVACLVIDYFSI